jgi:hypothetical protein
MIKSYTNSWSPTTTAFLKWKWCKLDTHKKNENPRKCKKLYDEYLKTCVQQNKNKNP